MADAHTFEADDRLLPLLEQVGHDGELTITREGRPVAKIVLLPDERRARAEAAFAGMRALRAQIAARGERFTWEELKQWRDEGRP